MDWKKDIADAKREIDLFKSRLRELERGETGQKVRDWFTGLDPKARKILIGVPATSLCLWALVGFSWVYSHSGLPMPEPRPRRVELSPAERQKQYIMSVYGLNEAGYRDLFHACRARGLIYEPDLDACRYKLTSDPETDVDRY